MKQIYHFEQAEPPILTEATLRKREEQKKLRRQAMVVTVAGILMQICILLLAALLYPTNPIPALAAAVYVAISTAGSSVLTAVFIRKRRFLAQ